MANEKRLIDANALLETLERYVNPMPGESGSGFLSGLSTAMDEVEAATTVDAAVLPKGRPGQYVMWDNGVRVWPKRIISIVIDQDTVRYDLGAWCLVVNHERIKDIITAEEAERWWVENGT